MSTNSSNLLVNWHSAKAAARIAGLSIDMVNYLSRYEIVVPSGNGTRGRGAARKYTYTDLILLRVIAKLLSQGISVLRLRQSFTALQKRTGNMNNVANMKYLLTDGYNVYFSDRTALEILESGQMVFAFVLELSSLRAEVDGKIEIERHVACSSS